LGTYPCERKETRGSGALAVKVLAKGERRYVSSMHGECECCGRGLDVHGWINRSVFEDARKSGAKDLVKNANLKEGT
jgi:hypothetical protein